MSFRARAMAIIAGGIAGLVLFLCIVLPLVFGRWFHDVEREVAISNIKSVVGALQSQYADLARSAGDWGTWDTTYNFMDGKNPDYAKELAPSSFKYLRVNLIALFDREGRIAIGKHFDLTKNVESPIPPEFKERIAPESVLMKEGWKGVAGIVKTAGGLMFVAERPILTSGESWPMKGIIVMGRYLDRSVVANIETMTGLPFEFIPIGVNRLPPEWEGAESMIAGGRAPAVVRADDGTVYVYSRVSDVYGNPALMVRTSVARGVYAHTHSAIFALIAVLIISGIAAIVLTLIVFKRLVLSGIRRAADLD